MATNMAFISNRVPQVFVDQCDERLAQGYEVQSSGVTHDSYGQLRTLWAVLVK